MIAVSIVLSRCQQTPAGSYRWVVRLEDRSRPT